MEEKDEKKEINPMNGAGEYLYFTTDSIVDPTTEGMPLTGGFDNGHNAKPKELIEELINKGFIQFEFINFIKGKTFENCICVLEEAEDLSKEDMLLILTRKGGDTCKMFISGDDKQISRSDLRNRRERSGLRFAANILSDMKEVSVTEFNTDDIVRDKLLTEIINKFEKNK